MSFLSNICCYLVQRFIEKIVVDGWLIWFDLVCELYLLFQSTQLEMNSPYLGNEEGDLFLVLSLLRAMYLTMVIISVQTLDFFMII